MDNEWRDVKKTLSAALFVGFLGGAAFMGLLITCIPGLAR